MKSVKILIISIVFLSIVSPVFAFQFSPLEQEFEPTGANSTKTYTIVNDSADSIAVAISALTRDLTVSGEEQNESAAAYFSIVPSKIILKPQSSQIVRVQYRGPRTIPKELSFRLKAEQIPYTQGRATENQSMFNFLYVYTTSLYITPSRISPKVEVTSAVPTVTGDGRQVLTLTIENTGTVHQILKDVEVEVIHNQTRQSVLYQGEALGFVNGLNLLADKTVSVQVAWPSNFEFPTSSVNSSSLLTPKISYTE
ncbi:MAG: fimbria/pilus periplasmic chaperone [Sphaerochaetaceae bacterium]|nr:fimbria/pilus periplasmic chaperone [Sphaerochaetaceae bacterium]